MASRFIVKAVFNGTSLSVPVSARTAQLAAAKAAVARQTRAASAFLVFDRRTGVVVHAQPNRG